MSQAVNLHRVRGQRGVTLIVVLMILLVVTVLGIGAAQIALLGERSTRYDRDYLIASQAAEAALMDAEYDIRGPVTALTPAISRIASFTPTNTTLFVAGCGTAVANQGLCAASVPPTQEIWKTVDFLDVSAAAPTVQFGTYTGRTFDAGSSGIRPDRPPRYIIEMVIDQTSPLNAQNPAKLYRITAIGFGPRPDIQVVMQTAFRKEQ